MRAWLGVLLVRGPCCDSVECCCKSGVERVQFESRINALARACLLSCEHSATPVRLCAAPPCAALQALGDELRAKFAATKAQVRLS